MQEKFHQLITHNEQVPTRKLFHISNFKELANKNIGDEIVLVPGPQGAEGNGVYFSESAPRFEAAEGAKRDGVSVVLVIETNSPKGWWRSKGYVMRRFNHARTWHSDEKEVKLTVNFVEVIGGIKYLHCNWEWKK